MTMKLTTKNLEGFPVGENPYWHDQYHMGQQIADGIEMMYPHHASAKLSYLIFVNVKTGERVRVDFDFDDGTEIAAKNQQTVATLVSVLKGGRDPHG